MNYNKDKVQNIFRKREIKEEEFMNYDEEKGIELFINEEKELKIEFNRV
jgi:hypothetical protein